MDAPRLEALAARLDRLERENRRWRRGAALALALAGTVLVAPALRPGRVDARQEPPPKDAHAEDRGHATEIARERLEVSRRALQIIGETINRGAGIDNAVTDIYDWSYRLLGDQIYLSMAPGERRVEDAEVYLAVATPRPSRERLSAFEDHYRRMRAWEERLRPLTRNGTLSRLDFLAVQSYRLQAELLLVRERIKEDLPPPPPAPDAKP